jgi:hypothetical protein
MTMTIDEFLHSLERTAEKLPALLARHESVDDALWEEYVSQVEWLLASREDVLLAARTSRRADVGERIARASAAFFAMREHLEQLMGISQDEFLRATMSEATAAGSDDLDESMSVAA